MGVGSCDPALQGPERLVRNVGSLQCGGKSRECLNSAGDCSDLVYILLTIFPVAVNPLGGDRFCLLGQGWWLPGSEQWVADHTLQQQDSRMGGMRGAGSRGTRGGFGVWGGLAGRSKTGEDSEASGVSAWTRVL